MFIVGNDISHYQGQVDYSTYKNNTNFLIAKATDGASYIDTMYGYNRQQARANNLPFGSYHFAEGGDVNDEAKKFCDVIDGDAIREGEVLCLDYELALKDPVSWCKIWLDVVSGHFSGIKPFIYLNQALVKAYDWSPIVNAGYPLWLASYTNTPTDNSGNKGKWPKMLLQQWTSSQHVPGIGDGKTANVDGDVFLGSVVDFKAFGFKKAIVVLPSTPEPTPTPTPVPTPTPTPTPTLVPSASEAKLQLIHDILWGKGFFWTKLSKIKALLPK